MKPSELYALPPIKISHGVYPLRRHIHEIDFDSLRVGDLPRIELRYYADECLDFGERSWTLYVVAFDGEPFMVCQSAGRGGEDWCNDYVTNKGLYKDVITYLISFMPPCENDDGDNIGVDEDVKFLDHFYSRSLAEFYDVNLKPKYKVGDVVLARVPENHLDYTTEKVVTRVRIDTVCPFNPTRTYSGPQLDRRWSGPFGMGTTPKMVFDKNNGNVNAHFSDADVIQIIGGTNGDASLPAH